MLNEKSTIRKYIRERGKIESDLGTITITQEIGEGGNALVFNALLGKKEVALKVLAEQKNTSKYRRFISEFREIIQLAETKAVVPIYYFNHIEIEGQEFPYVIMKNFPLTLKSWRQTNSINNYGELEGLLINLLDIVSVIHEENIVHRDIKPENILVSEDGQLVLADFGISWFDPEFFERFVHTGKGDRMANYDFSAPEQFEKGSRPHPTMDIFALGQIITWLVTGGVARGNRIHLTSVDESFSVIEPVVSQMLARDPKERPSSINEIKEMIVNIIKEVSENRRFQNEIDSVLGDLRTFDKMLLHAFPGKRGILVTDDPIKIERLMNGLSGITSQTDLWWSQGSSNNTINKIDKLGENTWIMDYKEVQVEKIWALKHNYSLDHQFLIIKTKAMPSFGIHENKEFHNEEAAWFIDRYISREEYDDGVAEIDGEVVVLEGKAELRLRNLQPEFYFVATSSHPIILFENEHVVSEVYKNLVQNDELDQDDITKLTRLKRHQISIMTS